MKVDRRNTEYTSVNERQVNGTVKNARMRGGRSGGFKYMCSPGKSNGECGREVEKRVQAGWNGWRSTVCQW